MIEEMLTRENVHAAIRRVVTNNGSPGIDGVDVRELNSYLRLHGSSIGRQLRSGTYRPQRIRRVYIPKANGGLRTLGIPTVIDRLTQQMILQILTPIFDESFSESSFGFRPSRNAHQAVMQAVEYVRTGYSWFVDLDLKGFFDTVNHDLIMARLARRVDDKRVLQLIRRYLRAGIAAGSNLIIPEQGTPQGGPLSPLLANILLDDLDKELERRGHRFCRYADDFVVCVQSASAGRRVQHSIEHFLHQKLKLQVNRDKSKVSPCSECTFLGYRIATESNVRPEVSQVAVERFQYKLLKTVADNGDTDELHNNLSDKIRGWVNYYALAENEDVFEEMDRWLAAQMVHRVRDGQKPINPCMAALYRSVHDRIQSQNHNTKQEVFQRKSTAQEYQIEDV